MWELDYEKRQEAEKQEQTRRQRIAAERKAAEDRARWKAEDDARTLKKFADQNSEIAVENMAKSEIRQILQDASASELTEVLRRIDASHSKGVVFMYKIYLDQVRAEKK
jgi:Mg/Co/Ni transporter MgtE